MGVASTSQFGQRLAAWSLSIALEGILEGKTIATAEAMGGSWSDRPGAASPATYW
jgi:hypothetical protein